MRILFIKRIISAIHSTVDVEAIIVSQLFSDRGVTLNIVPPNVTIRYCPAIIISATNKKLLLLNNPLNADAPLIKAFALNIFQNCSITKSVKNHDSSYCDNTPSLLKYSSTPISTATKIAATMNRVMEELYSHRPSAAGEKLKELLGHTPFEVFMGALLGIAVSYVIHFLILQ